MSLAPVIHYVDEATCEKVLYQAYTVRWRDLVLQIPRGFRWDGASVPRIVRSLIDDDDCSVAAALGHDFVYRHCGIFPVGTVSPAWRILTRVEADRLFLDLMTLNGVTGWKRWAAYLAVRIFGGRAWRASVWC